MARAPKNTPAANTAGFISDFPQVDGADLFQAFNTIAYFFVEPITGKDGQQTNGLAFQQERVLSSLCYSLKAQLDGSAQSKGISDRLKEAQDDIRKHLQEFNGTEIWQTQLARKASWAERIESQMVHAQEALRQAMRAHEKFTNKVWDGPTQYKAETKVVSDTTLSIAAKYGVVLNTPNTKGTGE